MSTAPTIEIVALAGMAAAVLMAVVAWAAKRWPTTEGRVVASHLEVDEDSDGRSEYATIEYEYCVAGRTHHASRIYPDVERAWSFPTPGCSSGATLVRDHPEGSRVTVSYCPWWPAYACLRPGCFGFPVLLFLLCAAVFWSARVHGRDSTPPADPPRSSCILPDPRERGVPT